MFTILIITILIRSSYMLYKSHIDMKQESSNKLTKTINKTKENDTKEKRKY